MPNGQPWTKISIVTPSYQQGRYIEETIRSVLLQNYPNLEYIVIDGGSTDETVEILQRYAPFLSYWVSEKDTGQANAINKGLRRATGEIIGWLNSDDLLKPNALYDIALSFGKHPDWLIVTGLREVIDSDSQFSHTWVRDLPTRYYLRHYCPITQETTYWRRELWDKFGELDETLHYALDYDFWLRIVHAGYKFQVIPKYLGMFRDYPDNKTNSQMYTTYARDLQTLYRRYDMGFSEEEVLMELGKAWAMKYRLFMALDHAKFMRSGKIAVMMLHLLEFKVLLYSIAIPYLAWHHFKSSYATQHRRSRWLAFLSDIWAKIVPRFVGYLQRGVGRTVVSPRSIRHIRRLTLFDDDNVLTAIQEQIGELPKDGLILGRGWYNIEAGFGQFFRWVGNDAEIFLTKPSDNHEIWLELEPGPGQGFGPFTVNLLNETGQIVDQIYVPRRQYVCLQLKLGNQPQGLHRFRLHVEPKADHTSAPAGEFRTLNFRVFELALFKTETLDKRSLERLYDIPFSTSIQMIAERQHSDHPTSAIAFPSPSLRLGHNWSPVENSRGETFRWINSDAEIIVKTHSSADRSLLMELATDPKVKITKLPLDLRLCDSQGELVGKASINQRQIITFDLNINESGSNMFRLSVFGSDQQVAKTDEHSHDLRVYRLGVDKTVFDFESGLERLVKRSQPRRFREFYKRLPGLAFLLNLTALHNMMLHLGKSSLESFRLIDQRVESLEAQSQNAAKLKKDDAPLSDSNEQIGSDAEFSHADDATRTAQLLQNLQSIFDEEVQHPLARVPILGRFVKIVIRIQNLKRIWRVNVAVNKRLIVYYQSLDERLNQLQTLNKPE